MAPPDLNRGSRGRDRGVRRVAMGFALGTAAAIVYASLYPFEGWRGLGVLRAPGLAFVLDHWPRYWTGFDLAINVAMYVPLGAATVRSIGPRTGTLPAVAIAALGGLLLSLGLEWLQNLVPGRVPSNLDLAANAAGSSIGALAAAVVEGLATRTSRRDREAAAPFAQGSMAVLLLIAAWLVAQFLPQAIAFATGDLRAPLAAAAPGLAEALAGAAFGAGNATLVEAVVVALTMVAVGTMLIDALRAAYPPLGPLIVLFTAAVTIKTAGAAWLVDAKPGFGWLSAGTQGGMVVGALALVVMSWMAVGARLVCALIALVAATALLNLAPWNEYFAARLAAWDKGRWEHIAALLQAMSVCWPVTAAALIAWRLRSRAVYNRRGP